jgi:hypothetical protein
MLRIEYKGQPYDWFNLDEMGDIVRTIDFSNTLRENITHYFGVPYEYQAIYDEEGLLTSMLDFARALRSVRPWLRIYDAREMMPELKERTARQLEEIQAEVTRSQRSLMSWGLGNSEPSVGSQPPMPQRLFSPRGENGQSPPRGLRDSSLSLADHVKNASELGARSQFAAPRVSQQPPTAFPWSGAALEGYGANTGNGAAAQRHPTPSRQGYQPMGMQMSGMMPPPPYPGAWGWQPPAGMVPPLPQGGHMQRPPSGPGHLMAPMAYGGSTPPYSSSAPMATGPSPRSSTPPMPRGSMGSSTPPMPQGYHGHPGAAAAAALAPPDAGDYSGRPPSTRDLQVGSDQAPRNSGTTVEVRLTKQQGFERFGFANVPTRDNKELVISWVDSAGLLQVMHNQNVGADQQIGEGDKILSVNGKRDDVEAMRNQLQTSSVHLIIQRNPKHV